MNYNINVMSMFSNELICNILIFINNNINNEIKINDITKIFYFDRTYTMKKFKKEIGITIINYINIIRIYNSLKYYKDNKSILEIALKNGFNSQEYYTEIFRKVIGTNPLTYKKYIKYTPSISNNNINTIQNNLIKIEDIIIKTTNYINNRKPKNTAKKLSLSIQKN